MSAGYIEEARAWRDWLARAVAGTPAQLQIVYGVAGERRLREWEVPWLRGYEDSKPVRVGNAAGDQLQLDVYGEMMNALYHARRSGLPESDPAWAIEQALLEKSASIWREPDNGVWQARDGRRHFTYSKMMAWVAFDRGIKSAEEFGLPDPIDDGAAFALKSMKMFAARDFDAELGCFVRAYGAKELDAQACC